MVHDSRKKKPQEMYSHLLQLIGSKRFLGKEQLGMHDFGLVIPSQSPAGFAEQLRKVAGGDKVLVLKGDHHLNSASLAYAIEAAIESHKLSNSRKTLFVTVGPGISVNLALYQSQ